MGNNDGPLRVARALRAAGYADALPIILQKAPDGDSVEAYAKTADHSVRVAASEAKSLPIVRKLLASDSLGPGLIVNAFTNYRFKGLLALAPCVNLHLGGLPNYRGRHPMHWGLINGETSFGVSLHRMNADFDDGAILWQAEVDVREGWSVADLREALMQEVDRGIGTALMDVLRGDAEERPNVASPGAYVPRRYPSDSNLVEWSDPRRIVRKVLALRSEAFPARLEVEGETFDVKYAEIRSVGSPPYEAAPHLSVVGGGIEVRYRSGTVLLLR